MIGAPVITPLQHYSRDLADPTPLHSTSLHDGVASRLRDLVFERLLAPGSFIDELAALKALQRAETQRLQA